MPGKHKISEKVKYDYNIELKYIIAEEIETPAKEESSVNNAVKTATTQLLQYAANTKFKTVKIIIEASTKKLLLTDCFIAHNISTIWINYYFIPQQ